jgi:NitT/TauT family transport system ATP-binding protein
MKKKRALIMNYLDLIDITVKFNTHHVLERVNLSVQEGEILAIIGPSGCGKTTLLNVMSGFVKPTKGDVLLNSNSIMFQKGIFAYMFQEDRLLPWRSLIENILLPDEIHANTPIRLNKARESLRRMGLDKFESYYPQQLSGGMRRRAALARTFFIGKDLILFDEPLVSIDYDLTLELERQIFDHVTQEKKTAIIVTHSYETAAALADRIILLTSLPAQVRSEFKAGLARQHKTPTNARKSKEFFELTKDLLGTIQGETR